MTKIEKKNNQLEYVRTCSIIAVVVIHTTYMGILQFGDTATLAQIAVVRCIMNLMWWAVPCFLMLSGSLLLDTGRKISIEKVYRKYVSRMLIVLFTFGFIFAWLELFFASHSLFDIKQIGMALLNVLEGNSWAHMWYVYCLIGLYLLLPLWKLVADYTSDKMLVYILVILLVCETGFRLTTLMGLKLGFYDHISTIYPFWLLMGIVWNRKLIKFSTFKAALLTCLSSLCLIIATFLQEVVGLQLNVFFGYSSIFVILQAVGLYQLILIVAKYLNEKGKEIINRIMMDIADKSFGIYIIHMVFVNIIYKVLKINPFDSVLIGGRLSENR